jgi:hypothetical protein
MSFIIPFQNVNVKSHILQFCYQCSTTALPKSSGMIRSIKVYLILIRNVSIINLYNLGKWVLTNSDASDWPKKIVMHLLITKHKMLYELY